MNIYVGNLSLETTEDELRREFTEFGEVISVTIMNDKYIGSGQPRGYGYVEMASKSEGATAIASLEGKKLRNRVVNVVEALPLSDKGGTGSLNIRSNNRLNKRRERKYQMI
jgi:RNA recognition motif-containing protein